MRTANPYKGSILNYHSESEPAEETTSAGFSFKRGDMPILKIFVSKRVSTDSGKPLIAPHIETVIEYDEEPFPTSGVLDFQFEINLAEPRPIPKWNINHK